MFLEHAQAYVITKRAISTMNFGVYVQVPALSINHPARHILPRPVHHDHYHVHGVTVMFFIPRLVLFLDECVAAHIAG